MRGSEDGSTPWMKAMSEVSPLMTRPPAAILLEKPAMAGSAFRGSVMDASGMKP